MRTPPRRADEHLRWLKANDHDLGILTGTDYRALEAIDRCWELYSYTRTDDVLEAIRLLLRELQPKCWHLARELIAKAMDWSDRGRLWPLVVPASSAAGAILDATLEAAT